MKNLLVKDPARGAGRRAWEALTHPQVPSLLLARRRKTLLANERYGAIVHGYLSPRQGPRKECHYHDTNASACQAVSW